MPKAFWASDASNSRNEAQARQNYGKTKGGKEMKFDVTKLTYGEIVEAFTNTRGTPFYVSKLGSNIIIGVDALAV
ncbi:MAG: hypothetical protein V1722_05885 [Candidatus Micrarchaeota archaeon]